MTAYRRTVRTQEELDRAIADKVALIDVRSPAGVWLDIRDLDPSATVSASDSATVRAWDSATVSASDSATVRAWDSATVSAWDSATVSASGSATVRAYGSATVRASDSATVRAYGSATVRAYGSATVRAWDSATVRAYGSATVRAWDSATVRASSHCAVHLHDQRVSLTGGVVIDHTAVDLTDPQTWCDYHGVDVADGVATLYKAVDDNWTTSRGVDYSPGSTPEAPDFERTDECGHGLHFGPTPHDAREYHPEATRYVAVGVRLDELVPISGGAAKAKAKRVVVACREVDEAMRPIEREEVAS